MADTVKDAGYDPYEHKVLGVTAMTKLLGRTRFEELLSGFIEKPQGKPVIQPYQGYHRSKYSLVLCERMGSKIN